MKEIDARGLACPAPVLQTKAALEAADKPNRVDVVVDNAAAQQNVQRFLESQGFQATLKQDGDEKSFGSNHCRYDCIFIVSLCRRRQGPWRKRAKYYRYFRRRFYYSNSRQLDYCTIYVSSKAGLFGSAFSFFSSIAFQKYLHLYPGPPLF